MLLRYQATLLYLLYFCVFGFKKWLGSQLKKNLNVLYEMIFLGNK